MNQDKLRDRSLIFRLILISLLLATLGCTIDVGGPEPPGPSIPVEPNSGNQVRQAWQSAIQSAATEGSVRVLLNESQLTGFLAERFRRDENPLLTNPQVYLRQGEVEIYGTAQRAILSGRVLIAIRPEVTDQGEIRFDLSEASIGPVPAPKALRDTISALLTEAFTGSIGTLATGIRITSLAIADGEMAIVGELR